MVDAAQKSGALITAAFAKAQGKEVYALPHEIHNTTGRGANRLIAEGAHIYLHPSQLLLDDDLDNLFIDALDSVPARNLEIQSLNRIRRSNENPCKTNRPLPNIEKQILFSLSYTPKTIEEISEDTMIDQIQLIELLSKVGCFFANIILETKDNSFRKKNNWEKSNWIKC